MTNTEDRLNELSRLVDSVTQREAICEMILATSLGMLLRSVPDALRNELMRELRACTHFSTTAPEPQRAEHLTLELEEKFDRLLDMIEHMARARCGAA